MIELLELEKDAIERDIPIMQKEGISFLIHLLEERHALSLLEIGSAIGYSSLMMCMNVNDLCIDTIERDDDRYEEACRNIQSYGYNERIHLIHADALELDEHRLVFGPYDVIFIDAAKAQYTKFFNKYIDLLKDDGVVVVDNLEFHGMIYHIDEIKNRNTKQLVKKIKRFKDWIESEEEFICDYHSIGDGIMVIKRK